MTLRHPAARMSKDDNSLEGCLRSMTGALSGMRRCLYKPRRPFKQFLDHVIEGGQGPETQQQVPFPRFGQMP